MLITAQLQIRGDFAPAGILTHPPSTLKRGLPPLLKKRGGKQPFRCNYAFKKYNLFYMLKYTKGLLAVPLSFLKRGVRLRSRRGVSQ